MLPPERLSARFVQWIAAAVLVAGAGLKLVQAIHPGEARWLTDAERLLAVVVGLYELTLAFLLVVPIWPRVAWATAGATFAAFAVFSATKAVQGENSCGCLGALDIDPRLMLGLDIALVAALAWTGPRRFAALAPSAYPLHLSPPG